MDEQFKVIQGEIKASETALKAALETQSAEIKKQGETGEKTAKAVAAAEARLDAALEDLQGLSLKQVEELTEQLTEAKGRIEELEKKGQRPGWPGPESDLDPEEQKSPGERFVETGFLQAAAKRGVRETETFQLKSLFRWMEFKATFLSSAATRLVPPQRVDMVSPALRRLRIRDLMPVRQTTLNAIEYLEEIGFAADGAASGTQTHGAAAPTAEGAALPEAQLEMTLKTANVQDIGHVLPASRQVLLDEGQMRAYINDRLLYGVLYAEEVQLLYGDGTSPNLQGLMTHPNRQTYQWSTGTTGDTKIDAIRRAATKAHVKEYFPTGVVINPNDWEDIELQKGNDQHYIWLKVASGTEERLFRLPVVVTNAMNSGDGLVGSFGLGTTLWDREQANIRASEHHANFFTERKVAILGEERVALTTYRPQAFVEIDFDAAPA